MDDFDFEIDVIFESEGLGQKCFSIEVNRFETFHEVKEKIQSIHKIPISQQHFLFNGQLFQDNTYVYTTPILHLSRIQLIVADKPPPVPIYGQSLSAQPLVQEISSSTPQPPPVPIYGQSLSAQPLVQEISSSTPQPPQPPMTKVTVNVKMPKSRDRIPIESDRNETVRELKGKIAAHLDMHGVSESMIELHLHSISQELKDDEILQNCSVVENSEIDVFFKPGSSRERYAKPLKVIVRPMQTKEKIEIEVFLLNKVSVLRHKLNQLHRTRKFRLPEDGKYFFIHKQEVMDENHSFQWHGVRTGHTIDTFDGTIEIMPIMPKPKK